MRPCTNFSEKVFFSFVLCFLFSVNIRAQSPVYYTYDDNGNRLTRSITLKKSAVAEDSVYADEPEKEIFKEEIGETQIRIYPNPTQGELVVEVTGLSPEIPVEYSVYSTTGTVLKKHKIPEHQFNIDFRAYPGGIYVLKLSLDGKVSEWKIIKE